MALHYASLLQTALRQVPRLVLKEVEQNGLEEPHHLVITFRTQFPGVVLPDSLLKQFPEEITIILQHQFWNLEVGEKSFSVTLKFGGRSEFIGVPFEAIQQFADPAAEFGLNFGIQSEPAETSKEEVTDGPLAEVIPLNRDRDPH